MAGGIDWFRWHHGSVTDPKFQLVARKAQARLGDVLAVWAFLLESASANAARGHTGDIDAEALDCLLGAEDGTTARILAAMQARGLWDGKAITAWDKRQPKREDDTAAERKRKQREREHELALAASVTTQPSRDDTANPEVSRDVTQGHDREEESREEKTVSNPTGSHPPAKAAGASGGGSIPCPYQAIVDAYHAALPELPSVRLMPEKRQAAMRKLWGWVLSSRKSDGSRRAENSQEALAWIAGYFAHAANNDFLMGRAGRTNEHAGWQCDIDFLLSDRGMKQVIEKTQAAA